MRLENVTIPDIHLCYVGKYTKWSKTVTLSDNRRKQCNIENVISMVKLMHPKANNGRSQETRQARGYAG